MNTKTNPESGSVRSNLKKIPAPAHVGTPAHGKKRRTNSEDSKIVTLMREGNSEGLRMLMQKFQDRLFPVAYRICGNSEDAEEVMQDVYLTVSNKISGFEWRSSLSTWLYRITVNAALMKRRSLGSQKNFVYWDHMSHTLGEDEDPMHSGMIEKTQDDALMAKELCEKIRDSYKDLPEIYQQVFSLRDLKGYSIKETSEMLNTTPATIKSRLHRGRGYIRANLSDYVNEN